MGNMQGGKRGIRRKLFQHDRALSKEVFSFIKLLKSGLNIFFITYNDRHDYYR